MTILKYKILIWSMFICLILYSIVDGMQTYALLDIGIGREANPYMIYMINKLGLYHGILMPKLIGLIVSFLALIFLTTKGGEDEEG